MGACVRDCAMQCITKKADRLVGTNFSGHTLRSSLRSGGSTRSSITSKTTATTVGSLEWYLGFTMRSPWPRM